MRVSSLRCFGVCWVSVLFFSLLSALCYGVSSTFAIFASLLLYYVFLSFFSPIFGHGGQLRGITIMEYPSTSITIAMGSHTYTLPSFLLPLWISSRMQQLPSPPYGLAWNRPGRTRRGMQVIRNGTMEMQPCRM